MEGCMWKGFNKKIIINIFKYLSIENIDFFNWKGVCGYVVKLRVFLNIPLMHMTSLRVTTLFFCCVL
jgi:hypothetical protein